MIVVPLQIYIKSSKHFRQNYRVMIYTCFYVVTHNITHRVYHQRSYREGGLLMKFIKHVEIKNADITLPVPSEIVCAQGSK